MVTTAILQSYRDTEYGTEVVLRIPGYLLSEPGVMRTDDIMRYLYMCLKHKKCAVCGQEGEIHHWDAVGMGNDRRRIDEGKHRKICLCRKHHTIAHQRGNMAFESMYHVYGIYFT